MYRDNGIHTQVAETALQSAVLLHGDENSQIMFDLLDRWDYAAGVSVVALLALAYLVVPSPVFQYAVWIAVFTIWMAWFVYFGTKYYYGLDM